MFGFFFSGCDCLTLTVTDCFYVLLVQHAQPCCGYVAFLFSGCDGLNLTVAMCFLCFMSVTVSTLLWLGVFMFLSATVSTLLWLGAFMFSECDGLNLTVAGCFYVFWLRRSQLCCGLVALMFSVCDGLTLSVGRCLLCLMSVTVLFLLWQGAFSFLC